MQVQLLDERNVGLGTGSIVQCQPYEAVCNQELGDHHVGVVVEEVTVQGHGLQKHNLVRWPISQMVTAEGNKLCPSSPQQSSTGQDSSFCDINMRSSEMSTASRKRKYSSTIRVAGAKKACVDKAAREDIQRIAMIDCCEKRCCQHADRDAIQDARSRFWQLTWKERVQHVYGILSQSIDLQVDHEESKWGLVFDRHFVCPRAWYNIYGISRATFFR
jgi:hypothetical protein